MTYKPHPKWLIRFADESNMIEGKGAASYAELAALWRIIGLSHVPTVPELELYVSIIAPGHKLRVKLGVQVRVGNHVPRKGNPNMFLWLDDIRRAIRFRQGTTSYIHNAYETLHPFTDGNGRSGRALWLWHKLSDYNTGGLTSAAMAKELGFLHCWYYDSLSVERRPDPTEKTEGKNNADLS